MDSPPRRYLARREAAFDAHWRDGSTKEGLILEAWGQGFTIGALVIMACITIAAMRKGVLLHKLILLEQSLGMFHGTFCFMSFDGYGWYVSSTATLLYCSYFLHNVIAWLKVKPFFVGKGPTIFEPRLGKNVQWIYCISLGLTGPVWIFETFCNFRFNNNINDLFRQTRRYEFLMRDPWWLFTNLILLHVISKTYGVGILHLIRISPRLGILLLAVLLAISFTIVDLVSTILEGKLSSVDGINPYWKLSLVFKCLTDAIMLDDFQTELGRLRAGRNLRADVSQGSAFGEAREPDRDQVFPAAEFNALRYPEMAKRRDGSAKSYQEVEDVHRTA